MSYKSILSIWDGKETSAAAISHAVKMASESNGHLHVICPAFMTVISGSGYPFLIIPDTLDPFEKDKVTQKAKMLQKQMQDRLGKAGILFSTERAILNRDELPLLMKQTARFCDIAVLPQPFGPERSETDEHITEGALFSDQCPVLTIPPDRAASPLSRVVIAWDGSEHALRATKMALPLLVAAQKVDVITIAKEKDTAQQERIAKDIALYLSRHQIEVDITVNTDTGAPMAQMILGHCKDSDANLIVMGGYGHSALREFLFGGATRDILKDSHIPVLMAH